MRLKAVSKSYVTYAKPRYWLAEFLGLGRLLREGRHYRAFWALRDIDLEVRRGAKVAIVGRNGAGKSTLLRIISENIAPTGGTVEVNGRCEALMQLGTGFNPEFSGRECIRVALAYMGVSGGTADEKLWDILEFSELDEFIDQPVRTYSTGMYLRLAFSVATVIAPEILIIDEVLGAGDLYFQAKCLGRIESLASGPGTTVLFVSHDLEAAQRLCDTFVWIDRGRLVAQGPASEVRAAYEDSVRRQQEARLRARNLRLGQKTTVALEAAGDEGFHLVGQFVPEGARGERSGPHIEAVRLIVQGRVDETIRVGDAMDDDNAHYSSFVVTDTATSRWSPPVRREGRFTRAVLGDRQGAGGAKFVLFVRRDAFSDPDYHLDIEVVYQDSSVLPCHLEVDARSAGLKRILSLSSTGDLAWKSARAEVPRWIYAGPGMTRPPASCDGAAGPRSAASAVSPRRPEGDEPRGREQPPVSAERRFGTGQVTIERVRFLDPHRQEAYVFQTGQPMGVEVDYEARDASIIGSPLVFALGFERLDGVMATTLISSAYERRFEVLAGGRLRLWLEPLLLTKGHYRVSVVLLSHLDLDGFSPHFTQSSELYDMHRLAYEVVVQGTRNMENGLYRQPAVWDIAGDDKSA